MSKKHLTGVAFYSYIVYNAIKENKYDKKYN